MMKMKKTQMEVMLFTLVQLGVLVEVTVRVLILLTVEVIVFLGTIEVRVDVL